MNTLPLLRAIVLGLAALVSMSASAVSPQEQEAMAATQAACDAFRLRDIPALERLLAPEFTLVDPGANVQLVRVNGQWRSVVSHVTRIPKS